MSAPQLARRAQQRQRQRVAGHDGERARLLGRRDQGLEVLDRPEEVRLLQHDGRGAGSHQRAQLGRVGRAVGQRRLDHPLAVAGGEGPQRLAAVRVDAARHHHLAAPVGQLRQVGRRPHRRGALVERGVRDRQPGQLADGGLVLEHHLQAALRDLGLVGRVRREELGPGQDRVDQRRHVVVVHAGPEEGDLVLRRGVARRQGGQVRVHLLLRHAGGQVERAAQADALGDAGEQLVDRRDADLLQHPPEVVVGERRVRAHESPER